MSQAISKHRTFNPSGFFARQFSLQSTRSQNRFDVLYGVVLPVLCFEFDPIVFKNGVFGPPVAGEYQVFVYLFSGIQITAMVIWLTFGSRMKSFAGPIAGMFMLGAMISFIIGIMILPFSLMGLLIGVGIFGFTPFVTGFVYLRNGIRGFRSHDKNGAYNSRFSVGLAAALITLSLSLFVGTQFSRTVSTSVGALLYGELSQTNDSIITLRKMRFLPDKERRRMAIAWRGEMDPVRRQLVGHVYSELTGESIQRTSID